MIQKVCSSLGIGMTGKVTGKLHVHRNGSNLDVIVTIVIAMNIVSFIIKYRCSSLGLGLTGIGMGLI